jgi:hypothetical protein
MESIGSNSGSKNKYNEIIEIKVQKRTIVGSSRKI